MGLSAIAGAFCFSDLTDPNVDEAIKIIVGTVNMGIATYHLKGILEAICKKTILKIKIEDINEELEFIEQEEKRGRRK